MLALINTNRMTPPIAPLGVEYVAGACRAAGVDVDVVDLCLAADPDTELSRYFAGHQPDLVGLSFRNVDDCFWPSGESFLPTLAGDIEKVRSLTDAPIIVGGVGFSIFAGQIVEHTGADFGIRGDGEQASVDLHDQLRSRRQFDRVPGLLWREDGQLHTNAPAWPEPVSLPTDRSFLDNAAYFRLGGQAGVETKRGCGRQCAYCADPAAKGPGQRLRGPKEVADEVESLLAQDVDVLHLCDCEFNLPIEHAMAVCEEFVARSFGNRLRWYAYLSVTPFDRQLAERMAAAGCVGINFTGDSANAAMLRTYRQPHKCRDLQNVVDLCRANGMAVMIDLLLGGPGETPESIGETIRFMKQIGPDCVGAALGIRLYPDTPLTETVLSEGSLTSSPNIHCNYNGHIDLLRPTFYVSQALGEAPASLVRDLIDGDKRFFEPADMDADAGRDHNYNDNQPLVDAIASGERGAYWDILRRLRARSGTG